MGVDYETYLLLGQKYDFEELNCHMMEYHNSIEDPSEWEDEEYYRDKGIYLSTSPCIRVISDGMSGEYTFIGCVLAQTPNGRYKSPTFDVSVEVTISEKLKNEIYYFMKTKYNLDEEVKLYLFTHYY